MFGMIHFKRGLRRLAVTSAVVLAALLLLATVVWANWTTIDVTDGQVDPNWGAPVYTSPGNNPVINDQDEIERAWFVNDGTALYFRIDTYAGPALSNQTMRAVAAIDCNNNGTFTDPAGGEPQGDRLIVFFPNGVVAVLDGGTAILLVAGVDHGERVGTRTVEWRVLLEWLYPGCRGSIGTIPIMLLTYRDTSNPGIVDSTDVYTFHIPLDYGDAPNPGGTLCQQYPTRIICNGPRHGITSLILGRTIDADEGHLHDVNALADDLTGAAPNDEDGVNPTGNVAWSVAGGGSIDVEVSGGDGYLNCWIDWNKNNAFEAGERVVDDAAVASGSHTLTFAVPESVTFPNDFYSRCRLSPGASQGVLPTGPVYGGEVEDYLWNFTADGFWDPPLAITLASFHAEVQAGSVLLTWETVSEINNTGFNLYRSDSPDRPDVLLAFVPSQAPGSTQGAAYQWLDEAVTVGQTYYYWLEDVAVGGATTLHGPVSVTVSLPTAVTLSGLQAASSSPAAGWLGLVVLILVGAAGYRRYRRLV